MAWRIPKREVRRVLPLIEERAVEDFWRRHPSPLRAKEIARRWDLAPLELLELVLRDLRKRAA